MDLEFFMKEALQEAKKAYELGEVPIGCVIVKDGAIIGRGHNRIETDKYAFAHAEINAIKMASENVGDWRLEGASIFTTLEPCLMCSGAIMQSRIGKVVFGCEDNQFFHKEEKRKLFEENKYRMKFEVTGQVLQDECKDLLDRFFRERRLEKRR